MLSRILIGIALTRLLPLAMTCLLAGCQTIRPTHTAETEAAIAADVCLVWQPVTYSSRDTAESVLQIRANNAARNAYCGGR